MIGMTSALYLCLCDRFERGVMEDKELENMGMAWLLGFLWTL